MDYPVQGLLASGALPGAITLPMIAAQADQTIVGNVSGGAASPTALTPTQTATMLNTVAVVKYDFASAIGGAADLRLARLGAASLRQGLEPSASPVAQTFTLGEASRPGTDSNVGGSSGTFRSGLGTGTGAASSLIFQTPTLAGAGSGAQSYATRLTIETTALTSTVPLMFDLGVAASGYWIDLKSNQPASGAFGGWVAVRIQNTATDGVAVLDMRSGTTLLGLYANGNTSSLPGTLFSLTGPHHYAITDATFRLGNFPAAAPVSYFIEGQSSRPGTDSNVGGADLTVRPGLGTGTGTASSLIFQTPTLAGAGSGAQSYATRLTIATAAITATVPFVANDIQITKTAPAIAAGTLTLNLALGNVFAVALTADITTMTMAGVAASGLTSSFQLMFTADGSARAVTYMAGIVWASGTAPTLTTTNNKRDWLQFTTFDGGTTWFGFVLGQNF